MGISRGAALTALVASSIVWLACSGEDEGTGKGSGTGAAAGGAGAAGSGALGLGGRAGGNAGGAAGAAGSEAGGSEAGGSGTAATGCLPALPPKAPSTCDGSAPQGLVLTAVTSMPIAQPLPVAHVLPERPNVFVVRARGAQVPAVVGRADGANVTWVTAADSKAWDQISGSVVLGNDLWLTSAYSDQHLWRCTIGDDLSTTCVDKGVFPHDHSSGTLFAIPPKACAHPEGALLDLDSPADGTPQDALHDAHLYDIATGQWTDVKRPTGVRRELSRVVQLRDGRAIFVGGDGPDEKPVTTTEIFDGESVTLGPTLARPRFAQGMAVLPDGRLLVTGGYGEDQTFPPWELVDVAAGTTSLSPQPATDLAGRSFSAATAPFGACGYVSIGGRTADESGSIDYFSYANPGFTRLSAPVLPVAIEYPAGVPLPDGSVLAIGGRASGKDGGDAGEPLADAYRLSAP